MLADQHGTLLVLGERECSIQRRHQKIIEESPSPLVRQTPGLRDRLSFAAMSVARSVEYIGAGTVEFLAVPDGRFWFLEMNTRLQVEHPVTECVTGVDLVELQLLVAAGGEPDPEVTRGCAVEARLYAEDPAAGWLPATGTLFRLDVPVSHPAFTPPVLSVAPRGVRLDAGVEDGAVIGVHYDPMLAKVIAWAPSRAEACAVLARTLARARIHGLRTNRDLLVRVLGHPAFAVGDTDTGFLDRHGLDVLSAPLVGLADERLAAVAAALAGAAWRRASAAVLSDLPSGWRNGPAVWPSSVLTGPAGEHRVRYRFTRSLRWGRRRRAARSGGAVVNGRHCGHGGGRRGPPVAGRPLPGRRRRLPSRGRRGRGSRDVLRGRAVPCTQPRRRPGIAAGAAAGHGRRRPRRGRRRGQRGPGAAGHRGHEDAAHGARRPGRAGDGTSRAGREHGGSRVLCSWLSTSRSPACPAFPRTSIPRRCDREFCRVR